MRLTRLTGRGLYPGARTANIARNARSSGRRKLAVVTATVLALAFAASFVVIGASPNDHARRVITSDLASWSLDTADSGGEVGVGSSIALDSDNAAHISCTDLYSGILECADNELPLTWHVETVEDTVRVDFSSIALDSFDKAYIAYYDGSYHDLELAEEQTGASWDRTTLDSEGDVGSYPDIAIDSQNKIHISYLDYTNGELKYATNAGGTWATDAIDVTGQTSGAYLSSTSIAVDSNDKIHISYYDAASFDLKYITNVGGSWVDTTVDSEGDVGQSSSLAVDSSNNVHISYLDVTNYDLRYATNAGGSWAFYSPDSEGNVGIDSSIALDSYDQVHISYCDRTNNDLRYATNMGGSWTRYTIDSTGAVGWFTSIAVDMAKHVHISYCDVTNMNLDYAYDNSAAIPEFGSVGVAFVLMTTICMFMALGKTVPRVKRKRV